MLAMIDNYDSFTYNVVQYLQQLGAEVQVWRNDQITVEQLVQINPDRLVISPGPCTPNEAGVSVAAMAYFAPRIPVLGICLGHQCLGQVFGGEVVRARQVMHGKTSQVHHLGVGLFAGLDSPFSCTRYHSLVVARESLPECLEVTAWTEHEDGSIDEIMGLRHRHMAVEGVQFHPESIMSEHGHDLLANFLRKTS